MTLKSKFLPSSLNDTNVLLDRIKNAEFIVCQPEIGDISIDFHKYNELIEAIDRSQMSLIEVGQYKELSYIVDLPSKNHTGKDSVKDIKTWIKTTESWTIILKFTKGEITQAEFKFSDTDLSKYPKYKKMTEKYGFTTMINHEWRPVKIIWNTKKKY